MNRKVTAHLFSTLNGVVENPNLWQFDAFGPEEGQLMGEVIGPVTDVVIGRRLWQEWSQFWPGADDPFGQFINPVRKHVVSTTLSGDLPWNSTVITGDPVDYVRTCAAKTVDRSPSPAASTPFEVVPRRDRRRTDPDHPPGSGQRRAQTVRR